MDLTKFSGNPKTEWIADKKDMDRDMKLIGGFSYTHDKCEWKAPNGSIINGASIPRALWSLIGSPYTDDYRMASIVHDVACEADSTVSRKDADKMFYQACRDGGCGYIQARVLYIGVRIGAFIGRKSDNKKIPDNDYKKLNELHKNYSALEKKLIEINDEMTRSLPDNAGTDKMDKVINKHRDSIALLAQKLT
ncbi:MAG: DUF1353 domain-containing protein [Methylophilaceae bacterium]